MMLRSSSAPEPTIPAFATRTSRPPRGRDHFRDNSIRRVYPGEIGLDSHGLGTEGARGSDHLGQPSGVAIDKPQRNSGLAFRGEQRPPHDRYRSPHR